LEQEFRRKAVPCVTMEIAGEMELFPVPQVATRNPPTPHTHTTRQAHSELRIVRWVIVRGTLRARSRARDIIMWPAPTPCALLEGSTTKLTTAASANLGL
jgi:hypothetical protein